MLYLFTGAGIDSLRSACFKRRRCVRTPLDFRFTSVLTPFMMIVFNAYSFLDLITTVNYLIFENRYIPFQHLH